MSERDFNMVAPAVWGSERFASLPPNAKLSFLYLLTSPHQNSAGGYRLPAAYAAADMGCTPADFTEAMRNIIEAGLAIYDDATKEVYVFGWFKHCPPTNQKHAKGTMKIISRISSDAVRETMEAEFAATEWGGKHHATTANAHPFDSPNQIGNRLTSTGFLSGRRANL
jgi:hypothetical protein